MDSPSTITSAPRARIPTSRRVPELPGVDPGSAANVELSEGPANVNKNVKSASTDPLDLAWGKIFGQFHDVFVNGDQAFPLDVTTEYFRVVNEAASDYLDPKAAASELQKFIASRK